MKSNNTDEYLFTSYSHYWNANTSDALLIKVNEIGDTLFTVRETGSNSRYYTTALINTNDDGFVICSYVINNLNNNKDYSLIKINSNNEILFSKTYGDTVNSDQATHVINTFDGGYLIVGQSTLPQNSDAEMYAVKTDSAGNFEWEQYYGGNNFEAAYSVIQTLDSGYLVLGWTQSYGNGQEDFYLVKTNKTGNQEWQKTYGNSQIDIATSITSTADGKYLISGASGGNGSSNGIVKKIDSDGIIIWNKSYTHQNNTTNDIWKTLELSDGSIISCGMTDINDNAGWLMKTDSAGNQIWSRMYNKNSDTDLFYDFVKTDDGGFVMCGQAWNDANNSQDAWLLKVDSLGCAYEDCSVGIEEEIISGAKVNAYPNPFNNSFNIAYLLEKEAKEVRIEVYDLVGRIISTHKVGRTTTGNINIDLGECLGIYVLRIFADEKQVHKEKLVCLQR